VSKKRTKLPPVSDAEEAEIQKQIAADPDAPELTDEQIAKARPFAEALPELAQAFRRARGRPKLESPKQQVTLRLSPEVLEAFKASGPGWQTRIDETLKKSLRRG
jgi:uncharacterized protein (DUF4415 family)